jgi:hypothetical protein
LSTPAVVVRSIQTSEPFILLDWERDLVLRI